MLQGLWNAMEGVFDTDAVLELDATTKRAMDANDKREKAIALLMSTIPPSAGRIIYNEELPSKALAKMKAHFDTQTNVGKGSLLANMFDIELSEKAPQEPELFDHAWTNKTGMFAKIQASGLVDAQGKFEFKHLQNAAIINMIPSTMTRLSITINTDADNMTVEKAYKDILAEKAHCMDEIRKKRKFPINEDSANLVLKKQKRKCKFCTFPIGRNQEKGCSANPKSKRYDPQYVEEIKSLGLEEAFKQLRERQKNTKDGSD